jgi:CheY-like chemotaxis protein
MSPREARVLLVGRRLTTDYSLLERLAKSGWVCAAAEAAQPARELAGVTRFDLILSETHLPDGSFQDLMNLLADSESSLYASMPVQDDCWWVPVIRRGQFCLGTPALRSREFSEELMQILERASLPRLPVRSAEPPLQVRKKIAS